MEAIFVQSLLSILTSATVTGILVFSLKSYISEKIKRSIQYEYDLKLDSHKSELQRESNKELEELKTTLKIAEISHSIKISALHEKQALAIGEIHTHLLVLFDALDDYTTIFQARPMEEKIKKRLVVVEKLNIYRQHLKSKAIYIPKVLHKELQAVHRAIAESSLTFMMKIERDTGANMLDEWNVIQNEINVKISDSIQSLEDEFRSILGAC